MNARIDPLAQQAEVGGRTYRLLLDCRAEAALVTVAEREYRVRLLQWREKAMLARFASLGQELVMREFVRMCADTTEELPPEAATVLWEVAAWINDPSRAGAGVPFDSRSVATVMLQLCKATQLRPADFDGRSALEVEEMWQALGGGEAAPAREVASASGTRIVIVPDEDARSAESGGGETPPGQPAGTPAFPAPAAPVARWRLAHVRNRATGEEPVEDRQSCLSGTRENGPNTKASGVAMPAPTRGMAGYKPALLSVSEERTGNRSAEPLSEERTGMEGGLIARHPRGERAVPTSVHGQQPAQPTEPPPVGQNTERRRLGGWPGAVSAPRLAGVAYSPETSQAIETPQKPQAVGALALQPIQVAPGAQSLRSPSSRVQPIDLPFDHQSLFDELADRLAEAAAEMGIGEV